MGRNGTCYAECMAGTQVNTIPYGTIGAAALASRVDEAAAFTWWDTAATGDALHSVGQ